MIGMGSEFIYFFYEPDDANYGIIYCLFGSIYNTGLEG